jgi:FMN-dependent oxidoreductase (nitrilotriacetate monooxygenase family)
MDGVCVNHIPIATMPHIGGWHGAAWRRPTSRAEDFTNPNLWVELAQIAEGAKLDAVFYGDSFSLWPVPEHLRPFTARIGAWDAMTISSMVAAQTEKIGIIATAHTEFVHPYALARQFATLDRISGGRAGWNLVTSGTPGDQSNFDAIAELASPESRYERAFEYLEVVKGLWDSWEDDAFIIDRAKGVFFDGAKLHAVKHRGKYFNVDGPLNVARPIQGYPVIAQAGGSAPGRQLAGSIGELLFTALSGQAAVGYRSGVRRIAAEAGRVPDRDMTVLAQLTPVVAETHEEAQQKWQFLQENTPEELLRSPVEMMLAHDLSQYPSDMPISELKGIQGGIEGYRQTVLSYRNPDGSIPTIAELVRGFKGPGTVVGSAEEVADYMEAEVAAGACDGFLLFLQGIPDELQDFVDLVIPELRRRGRFRTEYDDDGTLRGRFGFSRPRNQFAN